MWLLLAMLMSDAGMVMNANRDALPKNCPAVSRDYEFHIEGGRDFAADEPGLIFGMSQHEIRVEPCSRLTVTRSAISGWCMGCPGTSIRAACSISRPTAARA